MKTSNLNSLCSFLSVLACCGIASADVIRTPTSLTDLPSTMETFEAMEIGTLSNTWHSGNITFSSIGGLAITTVAGYGANGTAVTNKVLQSVSTTNVGPGAVYRPMDLTFDAPVKEVVLGWFDPNYEGNVLEAYDSNGVLLETAAAELGPVGGGSASWVGFRHLTADIKRVRMVNPSGDDVYAVDNIQTVVPAPGSFMALIACGAAVRRRSR